MEKIRDFDIGWEPNVICKMLRIMRVFICIFVLGLSTVSANTFSQVRLSIDVKDATLKEIFKEITKITGYEFVYSNNEVEQVGKVTMNAKDKDLQEVLAECLKGTQLWYMIEDQIVVISPKLAAAVEAKDNNKSTVGSGRVVDENKHPLPGVTVLIKGTAVGVVTGVDGVFFITIPDTTANVELVFSFIGMKTKTLNFKDRPRKGEWVIVLEEDIMQMDEVVVTGYTTLSRRESASAVTTIKAKDILVSGVGSIDRMLQGRIPGMMVMNTSGEPSATPKIRIRGNATINGNKAPVWVVDGVILEQDVPFTASDINSEDAEYLIGNAIAGINPQDIETITVLKDASATAIYGVKAANGVIVVTTKKGGKGAPVITYNGDVSVVTRPSYSNYKRMNSQERMELSKEIVEAGYDYPRVPSGDSYEGALEELYSKKLTQEQFDNKIRIMQKRNTDWFKELFRAAVTHTHNVNVSGGGEKASYYFSASYNNEQGGAKGSVKERFNTLAKVWVDVNEFINFQAKIDFSTTNNEGYHTSINPFTYAYQRSRTLLAYNEDGSYHMYDKGKGLYYNILKEMDKTGNEARMDDFNAMLALNVKLFKGLSYGGVFSMHNSNTKQRNWAEEESYYITNIRGYEYKQYESASEQYQKSQLPYGGILEQNDTRKVGYTIRNTLTYAETFGRHEVNVMGGVEARANKYKGHAVTGYGWTPQFGEKFMPEYTENFVKNYVTTGLMNPRNTNNVTQMASFFGTASYVFANRYVLNGNIRSDGANKFGSNPKYRWLPTWSIAGKWIITGENFMRNIHWINNLSLRGSYGVQGNIHEDATPNLIVKVENRDGASGLEQYSIQRFPNPDLRWEKTKTWNVALDFMLLDGRVKGGFDIYRKYTSDLIMSKSVATSNGRYMLYLNAGKMRNAGFEGFVNLELIKSKDIDWRFGVNFGRNVNEITLANGDIYNNIDEIKMLLAGEIAVEGAPVGSMYSFRFAGLSPENGYALFYAKDGRKVHYGEPDMMELVNSGSIFPKLSGGFDTQFTYKRMFSLSLAFSYNIGNVQRLPQVYEDERAVFDPLSNVSSKLKHRWKKSGDEKYTSIPALYNDANSSDLITNPDLNASREGALSYWYPTTMYDQSDERVAKGDFLKLKMVALSYMMPEKYLRKLRLSGLTLRLQVTNLFTIADKKWEGLDPESPGANIPLLPTYSLGINVSF